MRRFKAIDNMIGPAANGRISLHLRLDYAAVMRKLAGLAFPAVFALLAGPGCNSVTADQACTDLAKARCLQLQSCAPARVSSVYADLATCEAREKLSCMPSLGAPGTSATPDRYEKCASALGASACTSLFARNPPTECVPQPGKLADGAACGDDAQCASTYCEMLSAPPSNNICGVCGPRALAGGACAGDVDCDFGLTCANGVGLGVCVSYGDVGATCDGAHPCSPPNACVSGACMAPVGASMMCDRIAQNCDPTQALYCNAQSVCAVRTFAAAGEPCDGFVQCAAGGWCAASGNTLRGICLATVADGAACNPHQNNMPDCQQPARCLGIDGAMDGICTLPNPAACM
jgi:hypothetical protein